MLVAFSSSFPHLFSLASQHWLQLLIPFLSLHHPQKPAFPHWTLLLTKRCHIHYLLFLFSNLAPILLYCLSWNVISGVVFNYEMKISSQKEFSFIQSNNHFWYTVIDRSLCFSYANMWTILSRRGNYQRETSPLPVQTKQFDERAMRVLSGRQGWCRWVCMGCEGWWLEACNVMAADGSISSAFKSICNVTQQGPSDRRSQHLSQ